MQSLKGQLTIRSIVIGCIGCVVITTASMYTALKMGMLPWPILFAAIVSLFFIKLLNRRGRATNLSEVNVTHTIMSAGAMVAGGLAFTIPAIWMLGHFDEVSWWQTLIIALAGVVLGLIGTVFFRRHFIERSKLEYPLGEATVQSLVAGDSGGKIGLKLFSSLGLAGIYTMLRDYFMVIPAMLLSWIKIPGVAFGIYNSPMLLAVGFIVGTGAVIAWFAGAIFGHFGIVFAGSELGFWGVESGAQIASSLGMGLMMGSGVAVVVKVLIPAIKHLFGRGETGEKSVDGSDDGSGAKTPSNSVAAERGTDRTPSDTPKSLTKLHELINNRMSAGVAALLIAAVALILCFVLELGPLPSLIIVIMVWVTIAMSAQSVGQSGIDPMEIFGLIVLLIVAALSAISEVKLLFVAAIIAVACGLAGDLMNDFKAGHKLGTSPKAQWIGQLIGGILGALIAVAVLGILVSAYGTGAFGPAAIQTAGPENAFVATQASVVATLISGIPSLPAFLIGLAAGFVLYLLRVPSMMIGLGVYLPFYLSFSAFLGLVAKWIYNLICKLRQNKTGGESNAMLNPTEAESDTSDQRATTDAAQTEQAARAARKQAQTETGIVVSSGLLAGESIAQVIIALITITLFLST